MKYIVLICLCAVLTFVGFVAYGLIAPLKVHFQSSQLEGDFSDAPLDIDAKPFVGLALSGGGARAAVFAAAGMHELAERGLLQDVTHVSSVSGGGFPASYFALNPIPVEAGAKLDDYFQSMISAVSQDYFAQIHKNQILNPSRLMSPSRRLLSLQHALEAAGFLGHEANALVSDLPSDRAFFFNAVSYDTGRRFVFSNASLPHPDDTEASRLPGAIRALSFSDAGNKRPSPNSFPISLAVATSAAFPPYLGPLTIEVGTAAGTEFWHLGDGGVLENPGVETLREAFYATDLTVGKIYSFDAGQRLIPKFTDSDISIFSRNLVQFIDVILEYAGGHRDTLYTALDEKFAVNLETISFAYLDVERLLNDGLLSEEETARWAGWSGWSNISTKTQATARTPASRLSLIPTGFSISADDLMLIEQAARTLVSHHLGQKKIQ